MPNFHRLARGLLILACAPLSCWAQSGNPADKPDQLLEDSGPDLTKLTKDGAVWVDMQKKLVVADGRVAVREGLLEMFACPKNTKEHESIVAIDGKAQYVHAGLLAVGAKPGSPVKFDPEYVPATGTVIDVYVLWRDEQGKKHQARAQQWIRNTQTGQAMQYDWVFAGSSFWSDPATGQKYYQGDGGDFICVSNFPTATLDLPVESTQENADLLFEAFTARIPPRGTKVRLVLRPRRKETK